MALLLGGGDVVIPEKLTGSFEEGGAYVPAPDCFDELVSDGAVKSPSFSLVALLL